VAELCAGGELDYGPGEVWVVGIATAIALICFVTLVSLTARGRPWSIDAI
jgi:hypothetical protein